ncbi:hypothetical protein [Kribbella catacumbae]|uniref:hypothetical protein n=1 Tax=Kribbella catacumbae TaxID=460086 RepID=UPI000381C27B|nr:hypothetical protein [Kribbella catacumbae]
MPANGTCDLCGAEILWARSTKTGKPMPLDPEPCADGNLAIYRDHTGRINARPLKAGEKPEHIEKLGKAHFATCPKYPAFIAARQQRAKQAAAARAPKPTEPAPANVTNLTTFRRRKAAQQPRGTTL